MEGDEVLVVALAVVVGSRVGSWSIQPSQATITITEDDQGNTIYDIYIYCIYIFFYFFI